MGLRNLLAMIVLICSLGACTHHPFVSPLATTTVSPIFLPLVHKDYRSPDSRLGIAEHTPLEAELLGLAGADYVAGQWRLPLEGDTVVFLRPTERPHWSTWKLGSWSATHGWYNEVGFRQWIRAHPGMIYVVGNELTCGGSTGDGDWVDTTQYAQWYEAAWDLIKGEDATAVVAPYGPIQDRAGLLYDIWDSYEFQYGTLLSADFIPVHFYCDVEDEPWWCWRKLTHWIAWLESHRGTHWRGPQDYRLTEWGLPAWKVPVTEATALILMEGMIPELRANTIGITQFAWWPSGNDAWPERGTWLVKNGQPTILGEAYTRLAREP